MYMLSFAFHVLRIEKIASKQLPKINVDIQASCIVWSLYKLFIRKKHGSLQQFLSGTVGREQDSEIRVTIDRFKPQCGCPTG